MQQVNRYQQVREFVTLLTLFESFLAQNYVGCDAKIRSPHDYIGQSDDLSPVGETFYNAVVNAATDIFIDSDGHPDSDAMRNLVAFSTGRYRIVPGDRDTFGWLTGVIQTQSGRIVFG